jgi:hypothetical protein
MTGGSRSPIERVARQICKAIGGSAVADRTELESRLGPTRVALAASSRQRHDLRELNEVELDSAVALALAKGWLVEKGASLSLTKAGIELATRSRVGGRRPRWRALTLP